VRSLLGDPRSHRAASRDQDAFRRSNRRCRHNPLLAAFLRINTTSSLRFITDPNPFLDVLPLALRPLHRQRTCLMAIADEQVSFLKICASTPNSP
jgi:hypothetical protein